MSVGDINSNEKGSAARFNDNKPDYSLLLISDLAEALYSNDVRVTSILTHLGRFQKDHNVGHLYYIFDHVDYSEIDESTHVFTYGAKKYAAWNWTKGMNWSIPLACAVRHCMEIIKGNPTDEESGRLHVGHVLANVFMLIHYTKHYQEGNDLPAKELFL